VDLGSNFESVANWWLRIETYVDLNVMTVAAMWSIWKLRNLVFRVSFGGTSRHC